MKAEGPDRLPHMSRRLTAILTVLVASPLIAMSVPTAFSALAATTVLVWVLLSLLITAIAWVFSSFVSSWLLAPLREAGDALADSSDGDHWLHRMSWRPVEVVDLIRQSRAQVSSVRHQGQSSMLALASFLHDLKAPLAGSKYLIDTLAVELRGEQRTMIDRARHELRQVQSLVHDALSFSRLGTEHLNPRWMLTDVREVASLAVERLEWAVDPSVCCVSVEGEWHTHTDPTLLGRCLENLLLNAVRVARSAVSVTVRSGVIVVTDDGPGLPQRLVDMLATAQATNQVPMLPNSGGSGHGIGLIATVLLLTLIGGRLVLQSTGPMGTSFIVYLPDRASSDVAVQVGGQTTSQTRTS